MFNVPSDPWYTYMQPFRIVLLRKMIKAQQAQQAQQAHQQQAHQQQAAQTKKEENTKP
jgi:hypothetical protein